MIGGHMCDWRAFCGGMRAGGGAGDGGGIMGGIKGGAGPRDEIFREGGQWGEEGEEVGG
jgi:hypothetical protein